MKRWHLIIICFFGLSSTGYTQLRYGVKAGVNFSDVVINNVVDPQAESDYRMKIGLLSSAFLEIDLENNFLLWGEVGYSNKGVKTVDARVNLNYVNLPLMVQYKFTEKFRAEGGIELAYLVSATTRYGNVSGVWDNKTDLGLDAGLLYSSPQWIFGCRFNAGITSVIRNTATNNGEKIHYQNRVLSLSIARVIGSGKI